MEARRLKSARERSSPPCIVIDILNQFCLAYAVNNHLIQVKNSCCAWRELLTLNAY